MTVLLWREMLNGEMSLLKRIMRLLLKGSMVIQESIYLEIWF